MTISPITRVGSWRDVADAARTTVGKEPGTGEPSSKWKYKILLAEHSPIRLLSFRWTWYDIPYFVSTHFVRHKIGIEHFVKTSRTDRTGIDRNKLRQDNPVNHSCHANAQAIINISRKRLCNKASHETKTAWIYFLDELAKIEPELYNACTSECVYRGFCPEMEPCGRFSQCGRDMIKEYRRTE